MGGREEQQVDGGQEYGGGSLPYLNSHSNVKNPLTAGAFWDLAGFKGANDSSYSPLPPGRQV